MSQGKRRRRLPFVGVVLALTVVVAAAFAPSAAAGGATPIKIGILSDCKGAFGVFYEQDIGGAIAALAQFTGARPKNPNKPSAGITGGQIAGHPIKIVGFGCADDTADAATRETRRLMEQLKADILIGPLSGDESIAVANYAKAHPTKTFVNGTAAAQDTTLKVRAQNFFRFNGDGAMWNAGTGDLAYNKLKWRRVAVIADDYSFTYASAAGFIAEFCALGGNVVKRVWPPLNTTDYSGFARQLPPPSQVDGYFWAVGGSGLIPSLKAFESAYGPIQATKFIGNLFWGTPGTFQELGPRVAGAYVGGFGTSAGDLGTAAEKAYVAVIGKWFKSFPPLPGTGSENAVSGFVYNYYNNTWALIKALQQVNGDLSNGQKALQAVLANITLATPYGTMRLDQYRNAIQDQFTYRLYLKDGQLAIKTVRRYRGVDQTFGGFFSTTTPRLDRANPVCVKKTPPPWVGKFQQVHPD
jgi:branched-chain amino acid transport system substrate-binding protein